MEFLWRLAWVVILPLSISQAAAANNYLVDCWLNRDGLPQSSVTSIAQTQDGYLWLGTFNGLVRFDGVRFVVFDDATTSALPNNRIVELLADRNGRLWIMSEKGDLTVCSNGVFNVVTNLYPGLPEKIHGMAEGIDGIWLQAETGAYYYLRNSKAIQVANIESPKFGTPYSSVVDGDGVLWVTQWRALRKLEGTNFVTVETREPGRGFPRDTLTRTKDGTLLAAGMDLGLRWYRHGKLVQGPIALPVPVVGCQNVMEDKDGNVWVATVNAGLLCYQTNHQWQVLSVSNGLSINSLRRVYQDAQGHIWVGTDGGGLNLLRQPRIEMLGESRGLAGKVVMSVSSNPDGGVWISLNGQGIQKAQGGKIVQIAFPGLITKSSVANCLLADANKGMWISPLNDGGLWRADAKEIRQFGNKGARTRQYVYSIYEDHQGAIWMGDLFGLTRFKNGEFRNFTPSDGVPEKAIRAMAEDRDGVLCLGVEQYGLMRWSGGKFSVFSKREGLVDDRIWSLCADKAGTIWVGTYGSGLARFTHGHFDCLKNALPVREIASLIADDNGGLWAGTGQGLFCMRIEELNAMADGKLGQVSFRQFGPNDGMYTQECSGGHQPSVCKTPDGRLWFATVGGVAIVDPANLGPEPSAPRVLVEQVRVDNVPAFASGMSNGPVIVPAGVHHLEIRYTGISFDDPKRIQFRYRLARTDVESAAQPWTDAGEQRVTQFEAVPPGMYLFQVSTRNGEGIWSSDAAAVEITVLPEFWQRASFQAASISAAGLLLYGLYARRVSRFKRRQAEQAAFAVKLIESQERERKRLASELHDGLGQDLLIIKNRAALVLNDAVVSPPPLEVLREISAVASQAIAGAREISQNLRPYQLDHLGLAKALEGICRKVRQASPTKLTCEFREIDGIFTPEQEINIYRIVQEALNNIVKHAQATEGNIQMRRENGKAVLVIQDNGRGISPGAKHASTELSGGLGFTSMRERVRMMGGKLELKSAPGAGTRISIELPL